MDRKIRVRQNRFKTAGEGVQRSPEGSHDPGSDRLSPCEISSRTMQLATLRQSYVEGLLEVNEELVAERVLEVLLERETLLQLVQSSPCFRRTSRMIF